LRADAPAPHPRPQSRPRHHAVPDGCVRRPCASVSRWPYVAHLVQLLSASGVSPMCLSPDRALVGPPTGPTPGLCKPRQHLVYLSAHLSRPCWIGGKPLISMIGLSHDEDTFCLYAAPLLVKPRPIE